MKIKMKLRQAYVLRSVYNECGMDEKILQKIDDSLNKHEKAKEQRKHDKAIDKLIAKTEVK